MAALVCDICGGKLTIGSGGIAVCDSCGMEHTKERLQEKVQEIKGTVRVDNSHMVNNWMRMGSAAASAGNNEEAYGYFTKVIEIDPTNWRAIFEKGKAAAWQSTLANLRISELYQGITMALDIIANLNIDEAELADIKNEFAVALYNINNAITDMMQKNLSEYNDLYFDTHWDDMWGTRQRAIQNVEQIEDAMSLIADLEDDLSKSNVLEFKKRICSDLYFACDNIQYWTDYSEENLAYFGFSAKEKEPYVKKWVQLVSEIRETEPDYAEGVYSMIDPFDTPNSYDSNRRNKIMNYWTEKLNKVQEEKKRALAKERFNKYWLEHADEKKSLEQEKNTLKEQISLYKADIDNTLNNTEKRNLNERVKRLSDEKTKLGLFKSNEKKTIQEQIDSLQREINSIDVKIKAQVISIQNKIEPLQQRINEIESELTKAR